MTDHPLLRKQRQMSDDAANQFLAEAKLGRLAVCDGNEPYVVPIFYHYDRQKSEILMHCAKKGRKLDALAANARACFEVDEMGDLVTASVPCEFDINYRSVIAEGSASLVTDDRDKADALNKIFGKYAPGHRMSISPEMAKGTMVIRLHIDRLVGKQGAQTGNIPYPQP